MFQIVVCAIVCCLAHVYSTTNLQPMKIMKLVVTTQFIRSVISWAVTDLIGRSQGVAPLYGNQKRYPILAVRGFMGAVAMSLYYEAFERLMLGEAVRTLLCCSHSALSCLREHQLPVTSAARRGPQHKEDQL